MVPGVRSRLALGALIAIFVIPVLTSSLNGLTHVLTCSSDTKTPFILDIPVKGVPTISSAETIERGVQPQQCGGLSLNMAVFPSTSGVVRITLPITNRSRFRWHGTVRLLVGSTSVPVSVGELPPGATRTSHVEVNVGNGVHQVEGSLLFGP
jgi:hypothetical protein